MIILAPPLPVRPKGLTAELYPTAAEELLIADLAVPGMLALIMSVSRLLLAEMELAMEQKLVLPALKIAEAAQS